MTSVTLELDRIRWKSWQYLLHQVVADFFGDREERGYLFREMARRNRNTKVLILSDQEPARTLPQESYGRVVGSVKTKPFGVDVSRGTLLDYEIRMNATRVVTQNDGRKKRVDVWDAAFEQNDPRTPHDLYEEYLRRRLGEAAEVTTARVVEREFARAVTSKRGTGIPFLAATIIGTLKVLDSARLTSTVIQGIGRAKAFGCGLLLLSRPGSVLPRRYRGKGIGDS